MTEASVLPDVDDDKDVIAQHYLRNRCDILSTSKCDDIFRLPQGCLSSLPQLHTPLLATATGINYWGKNTVLKTLL